MFWEVSYEDVKEKIKLHLGEKQAHILQEFQTLAEIMKMAFGSGDKKVTHDVTGIPVPQNGEELTKMFNKVFR